MTPNLSASDLQRRSPDRKPREVISPRQIPIKIVTNLQLKFCNNKTKTVIGRKSVTM